jgi:hypothetical protein
LDYSFNSKTYNGGGGCAKYQKPAENAPSAITVTYVILVVVMSALAGCCTG